MKLLIVLALIGLVAASDHYDSKFDDIDVDAMLANDRLFRSYSLCFLDTGKCTPEGKEIKSLIHEAISTLCGKCTEKQKILVAKCISGMKIKYTEDYESLMTKYNPEGKYNEELEIFLGKYSKGQTLH